MKSNVRLCSTRSNNQSGALLLFYTADPQLHIPCTVTTRLASHLKRTMWARQRARTRPYAVHTPVDALPPNPQVPFAKIRNLLLTLVPSVPFLPSSGCRPPRTQQRADLVARSRAACPSGDWIEAVRVRTSSSSTRWRVAAGKPLRRKHDISGEKKVTCAASSEGPTARVPTSARQLAVSLPVQPYHSTRCQVQKAKVKKRAKPN